MCDILEGWKIYRDIQTGVLCVVRVYLNVVEMV